MEKGDSTKDKMFEGEYKSKVEFPRDPEGGSK